ncbi:MAG: hypothetical protein ABIV63_12600 [Caldimonas sp.]
MTTPFKREPPPEGSLEFEITDFSEARRALDSLPEGIAAANSLRRGGSPEQKRRPKLATDRALVGGTLDWMLSLPESAMPVRLADEMPRIANALASRWPDPGEAIAFLDDLFIDRRGGRKGLSPALKTELETLYKLLTGDQTEPGSLPGL